MTAHDSGFLSLETQGEEMLKLLTLKFVCFTVQSCRIILVFDSHVTLAPIFENVERRPHYFHILEYVLSISF